MKEATVSARVEADIKSEAEDILRRLGIPVSVAINSLYRQIIYNGGLPFQLVIPNEPRAVDAMKPIELDNMLSHSYAQSLSGQGRPSDELFDELEQGLS